MEAHDIFPATSEDSENTEELEVPLTEVTEQDPEF
jgi:hypothetical protein